MSPDRRGFLAAVGGAVGGAALAPGALAAVGKQGLRAPGDDHRGKCVISSGNGLWKDGKGCVVEAMARMNAGDDPVDAVVAGVTLVEDDPTDHSVGYGGLPNEHGVVQLDSSVMHGPTHKAGAVGCLENIRNPAQVALRVLKHTDHVLLVGEGARRFAIQMGFKEENLLTDEAREMWLKWKANQNPGDDWLDDGQNDFPPPAHTRVDPGEPFTYGTINCSAVTDDGNLASCTTTSGLSWKLPGRVGDSPIVGAGMFVDNAVGAAGATGRGEAAIQNCCAYEVVRGMGAGRTPTEACLHALQRVVTNTRQKRLLDAAGKPNFGLTLYGLRKDGAYGSATLIPPGAQFAVHDGTQARHVPCAVLLG
jgi:N4-(beta-N-acetylglucosaminyl)-L-asparaginase